MTFDPYSELGVDPAADAATIKAAYRRAAKARHPDAGGTAEAFNKAARAWVILSDPETRARWDAGDKTEPGQKPSVDAMATQLITQLLEQVLRQDDEPAGDLIKALTDHLETEVARVEGIKGGIEKARKRGEKLLGRARRKKNAKAGEDVVSRAIRWHMGQMEGGLKAAEEQLTVLRRAQTILREHELKLDMPAQTMSYEDIVRAQMRAYSTIFGGNSTT